MPSAVQRELQLVENSLGFFGGWGNSGINFLQLCLVATLSHHILFDYLGFSSVSSAHLETTRTWCHKSVNLVLKGPRSTSVTALFCRGSSARQRGRVGWSSGSSASRGGRLGLMTRTCTDVVYFYTNASAKRKGSCHCVMFILLSSSSWVSHEN